MFGKGSLVVLSVCAVAIGLAGAATAAVPTLPPESTVGLGESEAEAELEDAGYSPYVISRHGGGGECVVFNQVSVTDYNRWTEDSETSGTFSDDDEYTIFLSVNCTS